MLTHAISTPTSALRVKNCFPSNRTTNEFCPIALQSGLVGTTFCYERNAELYGEDEPADYVYQVLHGAVRAYKLLRDGRRQIGAFNLPGDVFGLDFKHVHRLTTEAIVDTTVYLLKRRSLDVIASTNVQVARDLWTITASNLQHAEEHMLLLGRKTAIERVAAFLLEMDRRLNVAGMLALPMSRRDIADYLGLTLETVSRTLSQLHDQGVLEFSGARQIVLRNRQSLLSMDL